MILATFQFPAVLPVLAAADAAAFRVDKPAKKTMELIFGTAKNSRRVATDRFRENFPPSLSLSLSLSVRERPIGFGDTKDGRKGTKCFWMSRSRLAESLNFHGTSRFSGGEVILDDPFERDKSSKPGFFKYLEDCSLRTMVVPTRVSFINQGFNRRIFL